jgi:hypothetical protein
VYEQSGGAKGVIRICKSTKDRQHNDQKKKDKRTNNDLQNIQPKHLFTGKNSVSTRFIYHMMLAAFNHNTTGATSGAGTAYLSEIPELSQVLIGFIMLHIFTYSNIQTT